jgi:glycosyltransferase involved in cell wall biosynthesis
MTLSITLPCFNEAENIETTIRSISAWMKEEKIEGEIIAVNDGSKDQTGIILDQLTQQFPTLRVIHHEENRGYGAAVVTGCDAATKDIIGFMDSDGQFDPKDFNLLLPHLTDYQYVTGCRKHRADPLLRIINAKLFGILSYLMLGIWVRDINCAMKVFRRDLWKTIRPRVATGALVNAEMFYRMKRKNILWKQVDVHHYPRQFGTQTGAKLSVILRMFKELWTLRKTVE